MANASKDTRMKYADLMRPHLDGVLNELQQSTTAEATKPQYLLFIRGVIPRGERLRRSPHHCRAALKRLLASGFYSNLFMDIRRETTAWPGNPSGVSYTDWRRYYINAGLRQLMAELEASGVVEYRMVNGQGFSSNAIGGSSG